uniref:F-box domain-containing protein n=1 Tax=Setaria viridis TaxID=4556 RepID=A0A4U6VKX7_SETVI|nr:hypothetical protein SEVIR_3G383700v2 [Setaria viridis]
MNVIVGDILIIILQHIDSPVSVVRAASACKRRHGIIADAGFLRRFRSVHALTLVAGDYFNDSKRLQPSFVPAAHRGSLLLLNDDVVSGKLSHVFLDIVVCEPETRRYKWIPPLPLPIQGLLPRRRRHIGMSNFKVLCMFKHVIKSQRAICTGSAMFTAWSAGSSPPVVVMGRLYTEARRDLVDLHELGGAGGSQYFYAPGRNLVVLDRGTGEFFHAVFPPPTVSWAGDFDVHVTRSRFYVTGGRDGKPRIFTVFDETMKVYARPDGGEWMLQKSLSLPEATRTCPARTLDIQTSGTGYVVLLLKTALDKWLISVDMETMLVTLAAEDTGPVMYRCEIPWPPVLNNV